MRTQFERAPWNRTLGQDIEDVIPWIKGGYDQWEQWQKQQTAEEERKAAEAEAEAARARAQAAAAQAAAAQAASGNGQILGIPKNYLLVGAVGVGVLGIVIALAR